MVSKLKSITIFGLNCNLIDIEVNIARGLHSFMIVGLPDNVISESRQRINIAIKNSDLEFPKGKIIVNLAPSDLKKEGSAFDLPIALAILQNTLNISNNIFKDSLFLGQLSLDGSLKKVKGILPITEFAKKRGFKKIFIPELNVLEASLISGIEIYGAKNLRHVFDHIKNIKLIKKATYRDISSEIMRNKKFNFDMSYIKGQEFAKRALEISAAGAHNVLMIGSPGSGKTLLSRAFPSILPSMTKAEVLELTKIYSVAGLLKDYEQLVTNRPFRMVHHSASAVSIIGGGRNSSPGEISLANRGVILFDEFAEFPRHVLESLRQPMEDKIITISRAAGTVTYPAQFILLAAMNPCKCGYYGVLNSKKQCTCTAYEINNYQKKISGPIIDRIDLYIDMEPVKVNELISNKTIIKSSVDIQKRVEKARLIQEKRFENLKITCNSEMTIKELNKFCILDNESLEILKMAITSFSLSARAYHRIIKISRTIADLNCRTKILKEDILEALQYRKEKHSITV